jgi:hypothetical protein
MFQFRRVVRQVREELIKGMREYQDERKKLKKEHKQKYSESELKSQAAMEEFREIMKMGGRNEGGGERKRKSKTERNNGEKLGRECQNYIK